jgi:hypothetical protein
VAYLQSDDALREDALCVVGCLWSEATDWLIGSYSLGSVHAYESHRGAAALGLHRYGVAVRYLRYPAVELVAAQFDTVAAVAEGCDALAAGGMMPAGVWL